MGIGGTVAKGVSGNNIVGSYLDSSGGSHGFLYNGTTYTTIDDPLGMGGTFLNGIDGSNIVGSYVDSSGQNHGFVATVPEPSAFALLGAGTIVLLGYRWKTIFGVMPFVFGEYATMKRLPKEP